MHCCKALKPFLLALCVTASGATFASSDRHWIQSVPPTLLDDTPWAEAAKSHDLDPWLLYAITLEESGKIDSAQGLLKPWPYQLHRQGKTLMFDSLEAAADQIRTWEQAGVRNYDIGPLQINRHWHGHRVDELADLLDVQASLNLAAYLLAESLQLSGEDRELGIGRYRSWKEATARDYARRIQDIRIQLPEQTQ